MSEHTTTIGPWRIGDAGTTVFGPPNGNPAPEIVAQSCKKNARLIAASPDLLEACRLALQLIRDNWPVDHGCEQIGQAWGALETAIQKAGGSNHE